MHSILFAVLLSVSLPPPPIPAAGAPCRITGACAAGDSLWLLCEDDRVMSRSALQDETWQARALAEGGKLRVIRFLDARHGLVAGDDGTLLLTEDGGQSWRLTPLPASENIRAAFSVGDSVWLAGWDGLILHSADRGRTWSQQPTHITQGLESIYFTDPSHGWAVGWVGAILRTTDGGATWTEVRSPAARWSLNAVYFLDPDNGWAAGFGGHILRTRDGGATWTPQESPVTSTLTSIRFDRQRRGWITTTDGLLLSRDYGETWEHLALGHSLFLHQLIESGRSIWAVGPSTLLERDAESLAWQPLFAPPGMGAGKPEETATDSSTRAALHRWSAQPVGFSGIPFGTLTASLKGKNILATSHHIK